MDVFYYYGNVSIASLFLYFNSFLTRHVLFQLLRVKF